MNNLNETEWEFVQSVFKQFPHCDHNVLHAPGKCEYCDQFPQLQAARFLYGINFTNESVKTKLTCPAEAVRPRSIINRWFGNKESTKKCGIIPFSNEYGPCKRLAGHTGPCAHEFIGKL